MGQVKSKIDIELETRKHIAQKEERNIFIEAGAGAGKSTSLVTRVYHDLSTGVEAKNIYVITFTNKATEELRVRILKFLKDYKDCDEQTIEMKKKLIKNVDDIHISTIHKFCEDILKENAVKAGLSPDFVPVVDEDEAEIKANVIRSFFRRFNHWDEFQDYEDHLFIGQKNIKRTIKEDIINLFGSMLCTADHIAYSQIYKCGSANSVSNNQFRQKYIDFLDMMDKFCDSKPASAKIKALFTKYGYVNGQSQKDREKCIDNLISLKEGDWMDIKNSPFNYGGKDFQKSCVDTFAPLIKNVLDSLNEYRVCYIKTCLKHAYDLYLEYCKDRDTDTSKLTNNDLIYRTYKLLKSDVNVLAKTRKKVQRLFIDEYQDTDSLQYKIASLIAEGRSDCLYIVGDPKQSIYRFRGAEPDVFFQTRKEFDLGPKDHAIFDLNINFRSNSKIIDWVNTRYKTIGLIDPKLNYVYSPMMNAEKNEIKDVDYDNTDNLIGFYSYNKCEPEDIRDLILYIKEHKKVRDGGVFRDVKFSDIMVLLENHAKMPRFVEVLTNNNIPAKVYGESRFSNTLAVRSFVNLFSALLLDNSSGLAQAEAVFYTLHPNLYKGKTIKETTEISQKLLNDLKEKTNKMNAYGKAIYLAEHLAILFKDKHIYEDYIINFASSKIYQMIEDIFSKGFYNGNELIAKFNTYYKKAVERESLIQQDIDKDKENGVDAVMVINLHKAKGLEAPIVIWASTSTRDSSGSDVSDAYKDGILYPQLLCNVVRKLDKYKNDIDVLKKDEEYENARKEYVAVTRPGEAFIFADTEDHVSLFHNIERNYNIRSSEDTREFYIPSEKDEPAESLDLEDLSDSETATEEEPPVIQKLKNKELEEDADESVKKYEKSEYSYKAGSTSIETTSPSSLEAGSSKTRDVLRKAVGENIKETDRPKSNDVGTILHRALQLLIKDNLSVDDAVKIAVKENSGLVPVDGEDNYIKFFTACLNAFKKEFKAEGYTLYPEYTFMYYKDDLVHNGSIDLLMVKGDEYIIVDYKSDEAEYILDDETFEITLREKYEPQLNAYEKVVKDIFGSNNIKKKIIYFRRYNPSNQKIDVKCMEL